MIIKYSAENFTVSFACFLKPGKKFLLTKKQTKLKVVRSIKEYDEQSVLVCFDEDKKVTLSNGCEVYVYNEPEQEQKKTFDNNQLNDDSDLKNNSAKVVQVYDTIKQYNYPFAFVIIFLPLLLLFWWLFDNKKNDQDA